MKIRITNKFHNAEKIIATDSPDYARRIARSMKPRDCRSETIMRDAETGDRIRVENFGRGWEFFRE